MMSKDKPSFKIVTRPLITTEIKNKIINEYKNSYYNKTEFAAVTSEKYNISYKEIMKLLTEANKPRKKTRVREKIDAMGGLRVIKALNADGWSYAKIAKYLGVDERSLYYHISKERGFKYKNGALTDKDVDIVKKLYDMV